MAESLTFAQWQQRYGAIPAAPTPTPSSLSMEEWRARYGEIPTQTPPPQAQTPGNGNFSFLDALLGGGQALAGFGKDTLGTLTGMAHQAGSLARRAPDPMGIALRAVSPIPGESGGLAGAFGVGAKPLPGSHLGLDPSIFAPEGGAEEAGATASAVGQYALGGPMGVGRGLLARSGMEAAKGGATALARGEDPTIAAAAGGLTPGVARVAGKVMEAGGRVAGTLAPRIINSLVKPVNKEWEFGRNAGRGVTEERITANSLEDLKGKVAVASDRVGDQVDNLLKPLKQRVSILPALQPVDDAIQKAVADGDEALLARLRRFKDKWLYEYRETKPGSGKLKRGAAKPTDLTPLEANQFKRAVSKDINWRPEDPYSDIINRVAKAVWGKADDIVVGAAPHVSKLNAHWADLISAAKAAERRYMNEQRRDLSGLPALMTGIGTAGASFLTGDQGLESIGKGVAMGALMKGAGSTGAKTRAASALQGANRTFDPEPLLAFLRSLGLGSSQTQTPGSTR